MLDKQSLEWLMACERLKDEAAVVEQECACILARFDYMNRAPTLAERDARRQDYLENRARLQDLAAEIASISRQLAMRH